MQKPCGDWISLPVLDVRLMLRDTLASLEQLPAALTRFRKNLPLRTCRTLPVLEMSIRTALDLHEAYNLVPDKNPQNG
jgi:hypothetical protein